MNACLYNSKHWGVAQNRERYFIVGVRDDLDVDFVHLFENINNRTELLSILDDEVPEKYFMSDEKTKSIMDKILDILKSKDLEHTLENIQDVFLVNNGVAPNCDTTYYKGTAPGDIGKSRRALVVVPVPTKKGYQIGGIGDSINITRLKSDTRRARVGDKVAQTILTASEQVIIDPYSLRLRRFTPNEFGKLQGFPMDEWGQVVSDTQAYKQFGNAVTVPLAKALAEAIIEQVLEVTNG